MYIGTRPDLHWNRLGLLLLYGRRSEHNPKNTCGSRHVIVRVSIVTDRYDIYYIRPIQFVSASTYLPTCLSTRDTFHVIGNGVRSTLRMTHRPSRVVRAASVNNAVSLNACARTYGRTGTWSRAPNRFVLFVYTRPNKTRLSSIGTFYFQRHIHDIFLYV